MTRPKTKILVDGGDPQETLRVKELLGFVDGQTTNPSLIAKNPHIRELIGGWPSLAAPGTRVPHSFAFFAKGWEAVTAPLD
jgi:hypothetical protein